MNIIYEVRFKVHRGYAWEYGSMKLDTENSSRAMWLAKKAASKKYNITESDILVHRVIQIVNS